MSRGRVVGVVATATLVVVAVAAGVQVLRETAPTRSVDELTVPVEPLAAEGLPSCERLVGDPASAEAEQEARAQTRVSGRVSSAQLNECPDAFDSLRVTYVGEVIGDVLQRRGGAWVLVNDDAYALESGPLPAHQQFGGVNSGITVWLTEAQVGSLTAAGRAGIRGDVIRVVGPLDRANPEDGGGLTLRADELEILAPARELAPPLHGLQAGVAALLAAATLAALAERRRRSRQR